jgi:hypothetical protein
MTCRKTFGSEGKPEDLRLLKSICQDFDEISLDIRKSILGKAYQEYQHGTANILTDFFNLGGRIMPPFIPSGSTIKLELAHPPQIIGNKVIHIKNAPRLLVEVEQGRTEGPIYRVRRVEAQFVAICMHALALKNGNKVTLEEFFTLPQGEETYRILEGTLPSHKQLIDWARFDIAVKAQLVPEDMECALDNFLDGYIQRGPHLPMVRAHHAEGFFANFHRTDL